MFHALEWLGGVSSTGKGESVQPVLPSSVAVHEGSPLGELHRCIREGVKVNVHIRTFKGLRGVCTGFLVAFDKFWNMVIDEACTLLALPLCLKNPSDLNQQSHKITPLSLSLSQKHSLIHLPTAKKKKKNSHFLAFLSLER